jgi:hypothetical protein
MAMKNHSKASKPAARGWVFAGALLALSILGLWFLFGRAKPPVALAHAKSRQTSVVQREPAPERSEAPLAPLPILPPRPGPRIERIDVDKTEVCYGEENFATVRASDASGASDRLIVRLAGSREMGFRLPFHFERSNVGLARRVIVSGPGGPAVSAELPEVKVKDCDAFAQVHIEVSLVPRSPHVLTLSAVVSPVSGERFDAVSYEWSFGDGTQQTLERTEVEHSYEGLPQRTRFSYLLISVKARDRRGRQVSGSRAYGFPNFGFGEFAENHRILIYAAGGSEPGAPLSDNDRIRLYHGYEGAVKLERVRSLEPSRSNARAGEGVEYSAAALLGLSELVPGKSSLTLSLSSLRPSEPGAIRKLEISGHAGSIEARGTIVLTSTAPRETAAPTSDPALQNVPSSQN